MLAGCVATHLLIAGLLLPTSHCRSIAVSDIELSVLLLTLLSLKLLLLLLLKLLVSQSVAAHQGSKHGSAVGIPSCCPACVCVCAAAPAPVLALNDIGMLPKPLKMPLPLLLVLDEVLLLLLLLLAVLLCCGLLQWRLLRRSNTLCSAVLLTRSRGMACVLKQRASMADTLSTQMRVQCFSAVHALYPVGSGPPAAVPPECAVACCTVPCCLVLRQGCCSPALCLGYPSDVLLPKVGSQFGRTQGQLVGIKPGV
jgi:hypothetical protein